MESRLKNIKEVEVFWDANPCGLPSCFTQKDKRIEFLEIERERYTKQKRIIDYANFPAFKGKKILEVGCGIGTDAVGFARSGALYTGIDLTEAAVRVTRERFEIFGLRGEIKKVDDEILPFEDNYFDHVYSFGVIHHSPHPETIVSEIYRVLKPGGSVTIMLYNRTSFYFLIEVCLIRKIVFLFCEKKILWHSIFSLFGRERYSRFELFREKLEKMKSTNPKPTDLEWVSMNTDHISCPIARVYSRFDSEELFRAFKDFETETWFIDKDNWFLWLAFGFLVPKPLEGWLETKAGWFRMIKAKK